MKVTADIIFLLNKIYRLNAKHLALRPANLPYQSNKFRRLFIRKFIKTYDMSLRRKHNKSNNRNFIILMRMNQPGLDDISGLILPSFCNGASDATHFRSWEGSTRIYHR